MKLYTYSRLSAVRAWPPPSKLFIKAEGARVDKQFGWRRPSPDSRQSRLVVNFRRLGRDGRGLRAGLPTRLGSPLNCAERPAVADGHRDAPRKRPAFARVCGLLGDAHAS